MFCKFGKSDAPASTTWNWLKDIFITVLAFGNTKTREHPDYIHCGVAVTRLKYSKMITTDMRNGVFLRVSGLYSTSATALQS